MANPQNRIEAVRPAVERQGGKVIGGYISYGDYDIMLIMEMPDNVSAAAFAMAVASGGAVKGLKTTPLLTPDEALRALERSTTIEYVSPMGEDASLLE